MAVVPIKVPDIGMKSEEIMFGQWLAQVGEHIAKGEDLFEIEADKATVICEAEASGTLSEASVSEGKVREDDIVGYLNVGC